jgi:hypothetical protein
VEVEEGEQVDRRNMVVLQQEERVEQDLQIVFQDVTVTYSGGGGGGSYAQVEQQDQEEVVQERKWSSWKARYS